LGEGEEVVGSGLELPETDLLHGKAEVKGESDEEFRLRVRVLHRKLEVARSQRRLGNYEISRELLEKIVEKQQDMPEELTRAVWLERALVAQDAGWLVDAQKRYLQYVVRFGTDPSKAEVQLRQGLLYREMGMMGLARVKFSEVVRTTRDLQMDNLEAADRLVLRAMAETGEAYYLEGKYSAAADSFSRLLKQDSPLLNREAVIYKLIQSLHRAQDTLGVVEYGQRFLAEYEGTEKEPEVRYILAKEYQSLGRVVDAKREIVNLLQAEAGRSRKDPANWMYWQKLAGNELANQFYMEGDFVTTRAVYEHLAALDSAAAWQVPVWYQLGLVYERLGQPTKALEMYDGVLGRETELTGTNLTPSLGSVIEMARWRKDALGWMEKARGEIALLRQGSER
jgi:tetratricopeptide (TPR) repeat protein